MQIIRLTFLAICSSFVMNSANSTETLELEATTQFGDSIFASIHPIDRLGGGGEVGSMKMIPSDYPVWTLPVELPAGREVTVSFYRRSDDPDDAGSSEGELLETRVLIPQGTPGSTPSVIHVYSPDSEVAVEIPGHGEVVGSDNNNDNWWTVSIPAVHREFRRRGTLTIGSDQPSWGSDFLFQAGETWWRHDQAFQYKPTATPPSNQREETFTFAPADFQPRTIRVLLPRGYDENENKNYPVIWAMDGQNLFSTYTGSRFGSWDLDLTTENLTGKAEIPEVIIVGVDNTSSRLQEYTPSWATGLPGGMAEEFIVMLRDELMPEVEDRYRTISEPEQQCFLGSSLGGLIGYEIAHTGKSTWGTVLSMSPSLWTGPATANDYADRAPGERARLWIDSGTAGGSNDGYGNVVEARDRILSGGGAMGSDFFHTVGVGDEHNEAAWRKRSPEALRWAFESREGRPGRRAVGFLIQ